MPDDVQGIDILRILRSSGSGGVYDLHDGNLGCAGNVWIGTT